MCVRFVRGRDARPVCAGERCASGLYGAGERCASGLYGRGGAGRGGGGRTRSPAEMESAIGVPRASVDVPLTLWKRGKGVQAPPSVGLP